VSTGPPARNSSSKDGEGTVVTSKIAAQTFWFSELSAIGGPSKVGGLRPSVAVARAENLGEARALLREAGLRPKGFRRAGKAEELILPGVVGRSFAWSTVDDHEWTVDESVEEFLVRHRDG
jgi:hypothetical protein